MVGDAASLRHQERVLTPFFVSRNVGAKILHVIANQRMTMAAGVFNDVSRPQWWATRRWKLGVGWGHTWLDRFDKKGVSDSVQTRIQWIY